MSLIHADFPSGETGLYGTDTSYMTNGLWAFVVASHAALVDDPDPGIVGNVFRADPIITVDDVNYTVARFVYPSTNATLGMASRIWLSSLPVDMNSLAAFHMFSDSGNTMLVSLGVGPSGQIIVKQGKIDSGTTLGTSANAVVSANAWQHIETKAFFSATVGTIEVRVEGVPVLTLTGLNTGAGPGAQAHIGCEDSTGTHGLDYYMYTKDLVLWDGAGSINNDFLGSVQVRSMIPDADVSFNWTASTGATGYNLIDESPPNDDTDYIAADITPPAASTFSVSDLPADVTSIKGLITVVRAKKTDGGDGTLQNGLVSGASTGLGSDRYITTAYTYWADVFELDPNTAAAWTLSAANAVNLQVDRTS